MFIKEKDAKPNQYERAIAFGIWDLLHEGHKYAIRRCFEIAKKVVIVLIEKPDKFWIGRKAIPEYIEPISIRRKAIKDFIKTLPQKPYEIVEIETDQQAEEYGNPMAIQGTAFVVCEKDKINMFIMGAIKKHMNIFEVKKIKADIVFLETQKDENGKPYSSTAIRSKQYIKDKCPNISKEQQKPTKDKQQ